MTVCCFQVRSSSAQHKGGGGGRGPVGQCCLGPSGPSKLWHTNYGRQVSPEEGPSWPLRMPFFCTAGAHGFPLPFRWSTAQCIRRAPVPFNSLLLSLVEKVFGSRVWESIVKKKLLSSQPSINLLYFKRQHESQLQHFPKSSLPLSQP